MGLVRRKEAERAVMPHAALCGTRLRGMGLVRHGPYARQLHKPLRHTGMCIKASTPIPCAAQADDVPQRKHFIDCLLISYLCSHYTLFTSRRYTTGDPSANPPPLPSTPYPPPSSPPVHHRQPISEPPSSPPSPFPPLTASMALRFSVEFHRFLIALSVRPCPPFTHISTGHAHTAS